MPTQELHVYGPPGCGKTTYLSRQIKKAADKFGPGKVLVSSFTKAAAQELASRDLTLPRHMVGTLHSICYRAFGQPDLAETHADEFNELGTGFKLSCKRGTVDEAAVDMARAKGGDAFLVQYQLLRNKMIPFELWPGSVQTFAATWEKWKDDCEYMDFTDLIETALKTFSFAPHNPKVSFLIKIVLCW